MRVEIVNFRPHLKNSLLGFVSLFLPEVGLELRGCSLHTDNGKSWIALPAKPYTKEDGKQSWAYILAFPDKEKYSDFQTQALEALDIFFQKNRILDNEQLP